MKSDLLKPKETTSVFRDCLEAVMLEATFKQGWPGQSFETTKCYKNMIMQRAQNTADALSFELCLKQSCYWMKHYCYKNSV